MTGAGGKAGGRRAPLLPRRRRKPPGGGAQPPRHPPPGRGAFLRLWEMCARGPPPWAPNRAPPSPGPGAGAGRGGGGAMGKEPGAPEGAGRVAACASTGRQARNCSAACGAPHTSAGPASLGGPGRGAARRQPPGFRVPGARARARVRRRRWGPVEFNNSAARPAGRRGPQRRRAGAPAPGEARGRPGPHRGDSTGAGGRRRRARAPRRWGCFRSFVAVQASTPETPC